MLTREYHPGCEGKNDAYLAIVSGLICCARGIQPVLPDAQLADLEKYRGYMQGSRLRPPGFQIYEDGQTVVGVTHGSRFISGAKLDALAVPYGLREKGFGKRCLEAFLAGERASGSPRVTLDVAKYNTPAINLYAQFGFVVVPTDTGGTSSHSYLTMRCEF